MKVIISGGGTGGHIYPGIAIADELKKINPDIEILFVGAEGKMEMEKVPKAGYPILALPIRGLQRKFDMANFLLPFRVASSLIKAKKILKDFQPDVVVGTGGYVASAILLAASWQKIPILIQEQNGYAGLTNKILAGKAKKICVAYPNMDTFFPQSKIIFTGNPVRADLQNCKSLKKEALKYFNFSEDNATLLILGGSLGAGSINHAVLENIEKLLQKDIQVIWQTGKFYIENIKKSLSEKNLLQHPCLWVNDFVYDMPFAYAAADVALARAGALTISELTLCGIPTIFVPSPNVAENHQFKNAMQLVSQEAALLIEDNLISTLFYKKVLELLNDPRKKTILSLNMYKFAKPNAAQDIVKEILKIAK